MVILKFMQNQGNFEEEYASLETAANHAVLMADENTGYPLEIIHEYGKSLWKNNDTDALDELVKLVEAIKVYRRLL